MENSEFSSIKFRLEQEIDTLKKSNRYLSDKFTEANSKLTMVYNASEHAAKLADYNIGKLHMAINQMRGLVEQLMQRLPLAEREQKIKEHSNILDTSKLL